MTSRPPVPVLRATLFNADFPAGFAMDHAVAGQLRGIYELLRNGRNVRLTLDKDDGTRVVYELQPPPPQPPQPPVTCVNGEHHDDLGEHQGPLDESCQP